jgi:hypothetical protein
MVMSRFPSSVPEARSSLNVTAYAPEAVALNPESLTMPWYRSAPPLASPGRAVRVPVTSPFVLSSKGFSSEQTLPETVMPLGMEGIVPETV